MGRTFERPSWQAGAGDKSLELFEFLELLVRVALQRQNPMLGTVGHEHTVEAPLPACLDYLLAEHILKFAHRDALKGASIGFQPAPLALSSSYAAECSSGTSSSSCGGKCESSDIGWGFAAAPWPWTTTLFSAIVIVLAGRSTRTGLPS